MIFLILKFIQDTAQPNSTRDMNLNFTYQAIILHNLFAQPKNADEKKKV
jgi:hypothetical protein